MSGFLESAERALNDKVGWAGVPGDAFAFVAARVTATGRWLIVVDEPDRARRVAEGLRFFHPHPERVLDLPADDTRPYDGFSPDPEVPATRIRTLDAVDRGEPLVVVAPVAALARQVPVRAERARQRKELRAGVVWDRDAAVAWLQNTGWLSVQRVEMRGCFAVRGDVLDLWPPAEAAPIRVDWFDDEIEAVRALDPATQRAGRKLGTIVLLPPKEEVLDQVALARLSPALTEQIGAQRRGQALRRRVIEDAGSRIRFSGLEDYLPALCETEPAIAALTGASGLRPLVLQPEDVAQSLRGFLQLAQGRWQAFDDEDRPLIPPDQRYCPEATVTGALAGAHVVDDLPRSGRSVDLGARALDGFSVRGGELEPVVAKIKALARDNARVAVIVDTERRAEQLAEMFANHGLRLASYPTIHGVSGGRPGIVLGRLSMGFVAEASGWAVIPCDVLFGDRQRAKRWEKSHAFFDASVSSLSELKEGDPVVHRTHGIGLYRGLERVRLQGAEEARQRTYSVAEGVRTGAAATFSAVEQDFVRIEYRDGALLLLPATRLDGISRYMPAHAGAEVKLDRLGGATWQVRRTKVRDAILKMADELLATFAKRELALREPYAAPGEWYKSFEAHFPYEETADQLAAIEAVQADLSEESPMDRLICGDVGYGKTEVAMRAAMRVVEGGRQVAVLCPTTVLAFQHYRSFADRFREFPIRVAMLSRFTTASEERKVLAGLQQGSVDVVVGTTRLLGRGVRYAKLGLMVIDEEHRFGVRQKEGLKRLRSEVDVLAMSATPIPRTLQMGLSGLREMSIIATPPTNRLSIRTMVDKLTRTRVREGVLEELARGGQVYFVHNRVDDIDEIAARLREWVPEATIVVGHGQMEEESLERVLVDFIERRADVLVASTIIESGVDLPNVNTMFVNHAERFGLAQLYQLRGRVGRGNLRGNCVLFVPEEMRGDARRRIRSLVENSDLGAGFRIAMADLELRGAGNLLGDTQSGNIDAVGYEAWLELLEDAVHQARGELDRRRIDPEIEVPATAFLPDMLIPDTTERLGWYKRLSSAGSAAEVDRLIDELRERHGEDLPVEVENLGGLSQTRVFCRQWGIERCLWLKVRVLLQLHSHTSIPNERLQRLIQTSPKRFALLERDGVRTLEVRFLPQEAERPFRFLRWVFAQLERD
jgi:transcription-repair coupling factor (superfamily II helicase)